MKCKDCDVEMGRDRSNDWGSKFHSVWYKAYFCPKCLEVRHVFVGRERGRVK